MSIQNANAQAAEAHQQAVAAQAEAATAAREAAVAAREQARAQAQMIRDQAQMTREAAQMQREAMRQVITIPSSDGPSPRQEKMMFSGFVIVVLAAVVIFYPIMRAFARRLEGGPKVDALGAGSAERLQRIEQAVDAMAIEIERISEGQRFTTKLLSSRPEISASLKS
jgi:multidrug efflux pump subunit AcrA (membrane-fusion protein)